MIRLNRFAALSLLLLASACAERDASPAPVTLHSNPSPSTVAAVTVATPVRSSAATKPGGTVVVGKGDTLSAIARRSGTDTMTLVRLNGLKPPYAVQAGQRLALPASGAAMATAPAPKPASTEKYDSRPLAVRAAPIPPPAAEPVSNVTVPSSPRSSVQSVPLAAPEPARAAPVKVEPARREPAKAPVFEAEAPKVEARPAVVAAAPDRNDASATVHFMKVPARAEVSALPAVVSSDPPVRAAERPKPVTAAEPEPKIVPISYGTPKPAASAVGEPPPRSGRHFLWPVKGRLISGYGPQPGGLRNDGFNIAASRGTNVVAADNGVVAYAGDDLKGFGNLVLIKHAGGFVTTYAHNEKLLVKRGDKVKRGQPIATVGDSGSVTQPQVHFQVRQGTHAVDPRPLMERS